MSQGEGQEAVLWKVVLLPIAAIHHKGAVLLPIAAIHHKRVYLPRIAVWLRVLQQDLLIVQVCHQM